MQTPPKRLNTNVEGKKNNNSSSRPSSPHSDKSTKILYYQGNPHHKKPSPTGMSECRRSDRPSKTDQAKCMSRAGENSTPHHPYITCKYLYDHVILFVSNYLRSN